MKTDKLFKKSLLLLTLAASIGLTSCNDYLSSVPKGQKIPTTWADYEAFLRDEYGNHKAPVTQAILLLNDKYESASNISYYPLYKANYMWDESINRVKENKSDEGTYYTGYSAISTMNLIIEHAMETTEASEQQKKELIAQAKTLRALRYYLLANYYSETYDATTASTKLSVPLIVSANINAPHRQVNIQELYDFILNDLTEALPDLPTKSATALHPNKGAGYALFARIYLQMEQYAKALEYADKALQENDELFDWTKFYEQYREQIEDTENYIAAPSPQGYNYVENYYYCHGTVHYSSSEESLLPERVARFEAGDLALKSRWKKRTVGENTFYASITSGYYNYGGLTTTEVYLIKAEALARTGKITEAMTVLNWVRQKRIAQKVYQPLSAANAKEAILLIRQTKENALILSIIPFADSRRFNKDPEYARTLTKVIDGKTLTLAPTSYMWVMPFPQGAIENPGNGSFVQNVNR